jgi:hypothetical protein
MINPVCKDVIQTVQEFTPVPFEVQKRKQGNQGTRKRVNYADIVTAFDIETSKIETPHGPQAFMYVWQWQIGLDITIVGRTWDEFLQCVEKLKSVLPSNTTLVVYVHNLSYEFQFLRNVYDFKTEDVFALTSRKVLKCTMFDGLLEFRCSYIHSNMSLAVYTAKMGAYHSKKVGDLDYNVVRYPYTPLSLTEIGYCVNDVRGLVEALMIEMEHDGDNLYTIPLTSTGYVRRDTKAAVRQERREVAKQIAPDMEVYTMLREAFRGGNCHANRFYADKILENVSSADRSSSYPDVLCNCKFPITRFEREPEHDFKAVNTLMLKCGRALLFRVALYNVRLREWWWGCPYLAKDKCKRVKGGKIDNGRILEADYIETTVTDVDWRIILEEYDFDDVGIYDLYSARYGYLPRPIIQTNIKYYRLKTGLKNVDGQELLYLKSKNKLNSIYGMMAQNPVKEDVLFIDGAFVVDPEADKEQLLIESNKKAFLAYQWGVWCTAWARYRLEEGIRLAGDAFVYADTDSVKYIGDVSFAAYNRQRIKESKAAGAFTKDPKGNMHYMGVYEQEPGYDRFVTLGAKKYCVEQNGKVHCTVSGVSKRDGGPELERAGGITAFKRGFVFRDAGGTKSIYNDETDMTITMPNGEPLHIGPNVVIRDSTYTLGVSAEYAKILEEYETYYLRWKHDI